MKVGGALLRSPSSYDAALEAVHDVARTHRLVIVPGGGPFADVVRTLDRSFALGDDAAHWLAIQAMDVHAELLAGRLPDATLATMPSDVTKALDALRVPILMLTRWLRERDPLPHSWDVTSDSIAAWVAGELCAPLVILLKHDVGELARLADAWFPRALRPGIRASILSITGDDARVVATDLRRCLGKG